MRITCPILKSPNPSGASFTVQVEYSRWQTASLSNSSYSLLICINLVQSVRSNAFYQSVKLANNSASMSKVGSDIILTIPVASLVHFSLLCPNWSSENTPSIFLSVLPNIPATVFAVFAMKLIVQRSLVLVALSVFKTIIVTSVKFLLFVVLRCSLLPFVVLIFTYLFFVLEYQSTCSLT